MAHCHALEKFGLVKSNVLFQTLFNVAVSVDATSVLRYKNHKSFQREHLYAIRSSPPRGQKQP